jgi:hypothetical protein
MSDWLSDLEKSALKSLIHEADGFLYSALVKYFADRSLMYDAMCSTHMRTVPRDPERASDYAARSEEARMTMAQLESFARDL